MCVCVCVCVFASAWGGGGMGKTNVIEVTMVIQFQKHPPSTHTHTHTAITSLRLSHPHFLTRTKKQIFLRGIPSVAGSCGGFSPSDLSEVWVSASPAGGSLLRYASSLLADLLSTEVTRNNVNFWNFKYFVNIFFFFFSQAGNR